MKIKKRSIWANALMALLALSMLPVSAGVRADTVNVTGAVSPLGGAKPGSWTEARAQATNVGPTARPVLVVVSFKNQPNVQFASQVWLPAYSRREVWVPVRCPPLKTGQRSVFLHTLLVDAAVHPEQVLARQTGAMLVDQMKCPMVVIAGANDNASINLAEAMRVELGMGRALFYANPGMLPNEVLGWSAMECGLVGTDNPHMGPLQRHVLRDWLAAGGRLWIQFSRKNQGFCQALLKNKFSCRTLITTRTAHLHFVGPRLNRHLVLRRAVRLSCVLPNGMKVVETVNGWPAVLETSYGRGRVYIGLLNGRGMLNAKGQGGAALWTAVRHFFPNVLVRPRSLVPVLRHYALAQIGYHIVGRSAVASILLAFVAVLLVAALWLYGRRRLERMAPVGAVAALLGVLALTIMGVDSRRAVPLTLSTAEVGYAVPTTKALVFSGVADVYSPRQQTAAVRASGGGLFWPDLTGRRETLVRMVWTDYNRWNWQGLVWPSGAVSQGVISGVRRVAGLGAVRGRFGPQGLKLMVPSKLRGRLQDLLVAAPRGELAVKAAGARNLLAGSAQVLASGQYVTSLVLGSRQQQRSRVLAQVLAGRHFQGTALLGWLSDVNPGVRVGGDIQSRPEMLAEIPITLEASRPGSRVQLAWPYLQLKLVAGPGQSRPALVYNAQRKKWLNNLTSPAGIYVRFTLPKAVLPLKVTQLRLRVLMQAPNRPVTLRLVQGTTRQVLLRQIGPTGRMDVLRSGLNLAVASDGAVEVEIKVGGGLNMAHPWGISNVEASVDGTVQVPLPGR